MPGSRHRWPGRRRAAVRSAGVLLCALLLSGCEQGRPTVVVAEEPSFDEPFRVASVWHPVEVWPEDMPRRSDSLDRLVASLQAFMMAGVHAPRSDPAVTIIVPEEADLASEVGIFIVIHGGANQNTVGHELRAVARRDGQGWWLETEMQHRDFCAEPLKRGLDGQPPTLCD
jgi:hypothetical protein